MVLALVAAVAAMGPLAWKQDRFVISMCNDPIVEPAELGFRYSEMAEANFTLVSSTAWLTPAAARKWDEATRMEHVQPDDFLLRMARRRFGTRAMGHDCGLRTSAARELGGARRCQTKEGVGLRVT